MLTIEQAKQLKHGDRIRQIYYWKGATVMRNGMRYFLADTSKKFELDKPVYWRVSGKPKVWKTLPDEVKVPIKHGLYDNGYLGNFDETNNLELFELE